MRLGGPDLLDVANSVSPQSLLRTVNMSLVYAIANINPNIERNSFNVSLQTSIK